jgi:hypothetical protein
MDTKQLKRHIAELTEYMGKQGVIIDPLPRLILRSNPAYADQTFCPTAHYSPVDQTITVYTAGRHPKDVLRSYAHELIHHDQHCSGMMDNYATESASDPNYAQNDSHLRKMEEDAYLRGNMCFRDWTDTRKKQ